ncbi:MAG: DUF5984 family protein [Planctomycetota bacterium]
MTLPHYEIGPRPIFRFTLDPVEDITPWMPGHRLSWFALTCGTYHIDLGAAKLYEWIDPPHHVEYQVAHWFFDLLTSAGDILDPIPDSVSRWFFDDSLLATANRYYEHDEQIEAQFGYDRLNALDSMFYKRLIDTLPLVDLMRIYAWRAHDYVYIEWDNRVPPTDIRLTADVGYTRLPAGRYADELRDFHRRLIHAMAKRVPHAMARADCDASDVEEAHLKHEQSIESELIRQGDPVDWDSIEPLLKWLADRST